MRSNQLRRVSVTVVVAILSLPFYLQHLSLCVCVCVCVSVWQRCFVAVASSEHCCGLFGFGDGEAASYTAATVGFGTEACGVDRDVCCGCDCAWLGSMLDLYYNTYRYIAHIKRSFSIIRHAGRHKKTNRMACCATTTSRCDCNDNRDVSQTDGVCSKC
jgi:hypothetical protein